MLSKPRGAGRSLLLVALLAATALMCAATSVLASTARAAARAPRSPHPVKHRFDRHTASVARVRERIGRALHAALAQRGVPYRYGGSSPGYGFDCSGLVEWAFAHAGLYLPHSSYRLATEGRRVLRGALRPGDLVFFNSASHVGIYLGGGRFIHAPHSGTVVAIASLRSGWYRYTFAGARRVL